MKLGDNLVRQGSGLLVNALGTDRAASNGTLRMTLGKSDSALADLRLWAGGALAIGAPELVGGQLGEALQGAGEGALHSFVSTERVRKHITEVCKAPVDAGTAQVQTLTQQVQQLATQVQALTAENATLKKALPAGTKVVKGDEDYRRPNASVVGVASSWA